MTVYYAQLARLGRITPEYEWKDDCITFDAKTKRVGDLAVKFLDCYTPGEGRKVKIAEGLDFMNGRFLDYCKSFIANRPVKTVKAGGTKVTLATELGGVVGVFTNADGYNYLSPRLGGLSFAAGRQDGDNSGCKLTQTTENGFEFERPLSDGAKLNARFLLGNSSLSGNYSVQCGDKKVSKLRCLSVGLNLGNEANLFWRTEDGKWLECSVPDRELAGFFRLEPLPTGTRSVDIASPKTGRAIRLAFTDVLPAQISIVVYPDKGDAKINAYFTDALPANNAESIKFSLKPLAKAELPPSKPFVKSDKVRILMEDKDLRIEHYARWGEYCTDLKAGDGQAAWLYNSHFQWCLRADVDISKLTPGVEYALRYRVRVEKRLEKGEAFWGGVYNLSNSSNIGIISPRVEKMDEEYHWYTAAKWIPDNKSSLMIWAGPGRYGKAGSAINAVYFDCMEIVPVEELQ